MVTNGCNLVTWRKYEDANARDNCESTRGGHEDFFGSEV